MEEKIKQCNLAAIDHAKKHYSDGMGKFLNSKDEAWDSNLVEEESDLQKGAAVDIFFQDVHKDIVRGGADYYFNQLEREIKKKKAKRFEVMREVSTTANTVSTVSHAVVGVGWAIDTISRLLNK